MSRASKPLVCLLRALETDDLYARALGEAGYEVLAQPVLEFTLVNQEALHEKLHRPEDYDGLIVTSPRAVEALAGFIEESSPTTASWQKKAAFAVGPKTASALRTLGFEPQGEAAGSAHKLANVVIRHPFEKPLLFVCGNRHRHELPNLLRRAQVAFEVCIVYETRSRTDMASLTKTTPDWLVFFSPSGVEAVDRVLGMNRATIRCAAIGPTTAAALEAAGWTVDAVAATPTPDALVAAVQEFGRGRGGEFRTFFDTV